MDGFSFFAILGASTMLAGFWWFSHKDVSKVFSEDIILLVAFLMIWLIPFSCFIVIIFA